MFSPVTPYRGFSYRPFGGAVSFFQKPAVCKLVENKQTIRAGRKGSKTEENRGHCVCTLCKDLHGYARWCKRDRVIFNCGKRKLS